MPTGDGTKGKRWIEAKKPYGPRMLTFSQDETPRQGDRLFDLVGRSGRVLSVLGRVTSARQRVGTETQKPAAARARRRAQRARPLLRHVDTVLAVHADDHPVARRKTDRRAQERAESVTDDFDVGDGDVDIAAYQRGAWSRVDRQPAAARGLPSGTQLAPRLRSCLDATAAGSSVAPFSALSASGEAVA